MTIMRIWNVMKIHGKEIKDECSECGKVLQCELFLDGHGIQRERNNFTEMIACQFKHKEKREKNEY